MVDVKGGPGCSGLIRQLIHAHQKRQLPRVPEKPHLAGLFVVSGRVGRMLFEATAVRDGFYPPTAPPTATGAAAGGSSAAAPPLSPPPVADTADGGGNCAMAAVSATESWLSSSVWAIEPVEELLVAESEATASSVELLAACRGVVLYCWGAVGVKRRLTACLPESCSGGSRGRTTDQESVERRGLIHRRLSRRCLRPRTFIHVSAFFLIPASRRRWL